VSRNEKISCGSDTINDLAARRAAIGSAPLPPVAKGGVLVEVELDRIEPNPDQPRQWIDPDKIEELAASIASRGTRQPDNPILLRPTPSGDRFVLVSGERRWRAKQVLRERAPSTERQLWNTIKALLHDDIDDEKSAFIALEENLQREDLSAIEDTYTEERGYPPYHPCMMVKVLVYGYCTGIYSSRRMAEKLVDSVAFRFLAA